MAAADIDAGQWRSEPESTVVLDTSACLAPGHVPCGRDRKDEEAALAAEVRLAEVLVLA